MWSPTCVMAALRPVWQATWSLLVERLLFCNGRTTRNKTRDLAWTYLKRGCFYTNKYINIAIFLIWTRYNLKSRRGFVVIPFLCVLNCFRCDVKTPFESAIKLSYIRPVSVLSLPFLFPVKKRASCIRNEWMNESTNERNNEWMNAWADESTNEYMNEWKRELIQCMHRCRHVCMTERRKEGMNWESYQFTRGQVDDL